MSKNENVTTAIFCTIVFALIISFVSCLVLILKYATVITLA